MYSGFDDPGRWVLPAVLAEQAARRPDARWIETTTGDRTSFGEAFASVERAAGFFASLGVAPGDHVAVMLPSAAARSPLKREPALQSANSQVTNFAIRSLASQHRCSSSQA
jgi:acyl-CoA synthetase (AMP-forming)/AMP-acid ligase II